MHTGSLAFGSAICTIIDIIKIFLYYAHKMVDKNAQGTNLAAPLKCILKCTICVAECFEAFVRYINHNAYIQMALTGKGFCKSAHNAFYLMFRNPALFTSCHGIGLILIFIGKIFIASGTTIICYFVLEETEYYQELIYSPICPCVVIFVVTYFIGYMIMNIYGVAADTILQCYCLDSEASHAKGRNKYTPEVLKEFVD